MRAMRSTRTDYKSLCAFSTAAAIVGYALCRCDCGMCAVQLGAGSKLFFGSCHPHEGVGQPALRCTEALPRAAHSMPPPCSIGEVPSISQLTENRDLASLDWVEREGWTEVLCIAFDFSSRMLLRWERRHERVGGV